MDYSLSENFKGKLFKERVSGTLFSAYRDYCPEVNGEAGLSRGICSINFYRLSKKRLVKHQKMEKGI